jgi:hypothetical protein
LFFKPSSIFFSQDFLSKDTFCSPRFKILITLSAGFV